ncbi:hypothetical protein LBMAG12_00140 [Actinomycetes bacterium]|nr:hypothetical protein LBMAG12_00140 [Actinomycetes bacterium]
MNFKKLSMMALSIASLAGMLAIPSQVHAGADSSTGDILGVAGSDTTYYVMNALVDAHNLSTRYNPNKDKAVNIPPLVSANANVEVGEASLATTSWLKDARLAWPGGAVLPADANCTTQYVFGGAGSVDTLGDGDVSGTSAPDIDVPFTPVTSVPGGPSGSTYTVRLGVQPPNGSGDGRNALKGSAVKGVTYNTITNDFACLDIARSSSYPTSSDVPSNLEAWAFALDAIGWTYFPGNTHSSSIAAGLTTTQLNNIYQCATASVDNSTPPDGDYTDVGDQKNGYPKWRYWGDISGDKTDTTAIAAYRVQAGSGTGKDIAQTFMGRTDGIDSEVLKNCDSSTNNTDSDTATTWTFPIVQEHDCRNVSDANKPHAICWYGYSRWVLQSRSLETDKRNGAIFGKYGTSTTDMKRPSFSSINDTANRYMGTRWIYNVIPQNASADVGRSGDARRFVGVSKQSAACVAAAVASVINETTMTPATDCNFDGDVTDTSVALGGVPGYICGDAVARRIIASFGFKPLAMGTTDLASADYGQSYCRRNKSAF